MVFSKPVRILQKKQFYSTKTLTVQEDLLSLQKTKVPLSGEALKGDLIFTLALVLL